MSLKFSLTSDPLAVQRYFACRTMDNFPPRKVILPSEPVMIVRRGYDGSNDSYLLRWGLIPSWVKDIRNLAMLSVARSETIMEKPSFRGCIRHKRCLVPANGFFIGSNSAKSARSKPRSAHAADYHYIRSKNFDLLGLAGVYDEWLGADGSEINSMALITGPVPSHLGKFAARMPCLIAPENFDRWLDCRGVSPEDALACVSDAGHMACDMSQPK